MHSSQPLQRSVAIRSGDQAGDATSSATAMAKTHLRTLASRVPSPAARAERRGIGVGWARDNGPVEDERAEKRRRVLAILDALELEAVVLRDPANIAWYGGGARARIVEGGDPGVFDIVVRRDGDEIATDEIEAPRPADEERAGGAAAVRDALVRARQRLTPPEIERYARLGADAAAAMTDAILALTPAMSEWTAAGELAARLLQRGLTPVLLPAAGEARLGPSRHPLPTAAPLGRRGMLVVCGRRDGLLAHLPRLFAFGPIEPEGAERYERLLRVEAAFLDALRPGRA